MVGPASAHGECSSDGDCYSGRERRTEDGNMGATGEMTMWTATTFYYFFYSFKIHCGYRHAKGKTTEKVEKTIQWK